jgi:hypothetical protein
MLAPSPCKKTKTKEQHINVESSEDTKEEGIMMDVSKPNWKLTHCDWSSSSRKQR